MRCKSLFLLAAAGLVQADLPSNIGDLIPTEIPTNLIPTDIAIPSIPTDLSNLFTYIPPDIFSSFTANPTQYLQGLYSSLSAGQTPAWVNNIPTSLLGALGTQLPTALPTSQPTSGGSNGGSSGGSQTPNIAPRPTGAVIAGLAGAAGILGLAIAL